MDLNDFITYRWYRHFRDRQNCPRAAAALWAWRNRHRMNIPRQASR